jgi:hypothetical protein
LLIVAKGSHNNLLSGFITHFCRFHTMQFLSNIIKGILGFITGFLKPKGFALEYKEDATPKAEAPKAEAASPAPALAVSEAPSAPAPASKAKKTKTFRGAKAPEASAPAAAPAAPAAAPVVVPAAALNLPAPTVTFADVAMNPASGASVSRRRPGANMTGFISMARQVSPSR